MRKEFLETGKIVGTHGVRGMVRIEVWADDVAFLKKFNIFYLKDGTSLTLSKITPHGNVAIAAIEGVDTVEAAENYRGKILSVKREDINLPEGRYLISEIIGAKVYDNDSGKLLGILSDVMKTGSNDVWQVTNEDKNYLVPVIKEINAQVDIDTDTVKITPLKGIFDDEN